jgi:hypothetical protein
LIVKILIIVGVVYAICCYGFAAWVNHFSDKWSRDEWVWFLLAPVAVPLALVFTIGYHE